MSVCPMANWTAHVNIKTANLPGTNISVASMAEWQFINEYFIQFNLTRTRNSFLCARVEYSCWTYNKLTNLNSIMLKSIDLTTWCTTHTESIYESCHIKRKMNNKSATFSLPWDIYIYTKKWFEKKWRRNYVKGKISKNIDIYENIIIWKSANLGCKEDVQYMIITDL